MRFRVITLPKSKWSPTALAYSAEVASATKAGRPWYLSTRFLGRNPPTFVGRSRLRTAKAEAHPPSPRLRRVPTSHSSAGLDPWLSAKEGKGPSRSRALSLSHAASLQSFNTTTVKWAFLAAPYEKALLVGRCIQTQVTQNGHGAIMAWRSVDGTPRISACRREVKVMDRRTVVGNARVGP